MPHLTYGAALAPLLRLGRGEEAAAYAARGREMVAGDPSFLATQAEHLAYLAQTDASLGLDWYARHLPWAEQSLEAKSRLDFHLASALLFGRLRGELALPLPPEVKGYRENGLYGAKERLAYHAAEAEKLAAQFDARNGTAYYARQLQRALETP